MKKLLVLVLAIVMVFSVVACSGGQQAAAPASDAAVKMGRVDFASHGTSAYSTVVVAMQGDKIAGVSLDEYQFMAKDKIKAGVPNSLEMGTPDHKGFAANFADPNVILASKRTNTEYYSNNMKEKAKSTVAIDKNFDAIEQFCVGKTIAEVQAEIDKKAEAAADAITGATLADTNGYLAAIVAAAQAAK